MYTVSVPLVSQTLHRSDRKDLAQRLKSAGVSRIFLSIGTYIADPEKRSACMETLRENCAFFKAEGFETGVWVWTIQFPKENAYTKITSIYGEVRQHEVCPADPAFRDFAAGYVKELAGCGVDIILFDDDYRLTVHNADLACACELHLGLTGKILGRPVTRQEIENAMVGPQNPVRSAFQQAKRESLLEFARRMRQALDTVDPRIRMGLCAGMAAWDVDGIDAPSISRVLAGNTKPLLRLIAAPYWVPMKLWNNRLQDVIEMSRMERSWCGEGIEILAEGDTYPRPRFTCPAAFLEGFDTAMRADGTVDGILKYMVDYWSTAGYEPGYLAFHQRNQELYRQLAQDFAPKKAAGIRVYEAMRKIEGQDFPESAEKPRNFHRYLFSYAARMLSANGIPTTYDGTGCAGICFGENAKKLPDEALENGLILDGKAALLLQEQGVDTGIENFLGDFQSQEEYFPHQKERALTSSPVMALALKDGAQILSWHMWDDQKVPGSYFYENEAGQRFFVLCFDGCFCKERLFRQYTRSRQIGNILPRLSGRTLPAHCPGNPDLYLMCKEDGGEMAVGLWNFCADPVLQPQIKLEKAFYNIHFIRCSGQLEGDTVTLSELPPYGFCGFVVR
jgi:hypothetical protein